MKKIIAVVLRDMKASIRDFMVVYIILAPFLLAFILKGLTASAGDTTFNLVVDDTVPDHVVEYLVAYAAVERVDSADGVTRRVEAMDDVLGVRYLEGRYQIVREGNEVGEPQELIAHLLNAYENADIEVPVTVSVSDIGWILSPMKQYGGGLIAVFISLFGGMVILINLVEEKAENTLSAVNVSSLTRTEYVMGKAFLGFLLPLLHVSGILLILDYGRINYAMALVVTFSIAVISVIIGFGIGVNNDNVIGAISGFKVLFVPILGSILGAIFLREGLQWLLYWSPFYWAFIAMDSIILQTATWGSILFQTGLILVLAAGVFLLLSKKIRQGMR